MENEGSLTSSPIVELLAQYEPQTPAEASDLERFVRLSQADNPWHRGNPIHFTASALIVHPPTRQALLRWHARQESWLQVGGHGDPGETNPLDIALREGREETGLTDLVPWPDASLIQIVAVPVPDSPKEPAHTHADLRFLLATETPERARPEKPSAPVQWLSIPEARELATEDNFRETLDRAGRLLSAPGAQS